MDASKEAVPNEIQNAIVGLAPAPMPQPGSLISVQNSHECRRLDDTALVEFLKKQRYRRGGLVGETIQNLVDILERRSVLMENTQRFSWGIQEKIVAFARNAKGQNVIKRHGCADHLEFLILCRQKPSTIPMTLDQEHLCYACHRPTMSLHANYCFCCLKCGNTFQKMVSMKPASCLKGKVAVVTGARTKLGHQIVLRLLQHGMRVIGVTRKPKEAMDLYDSYRSKDLLDVELDGLDIYPFSFDLDCDDIQGVVRNLAQYIETRYNKVDLVVNCAAQTIRVREKGISVDVPITRDTTEDSHENSHDFLETNRYGDAKFVHSSQINSWRQSIMDLVQQEMEEVFRVNAIGPTLIIQGLRHLMDKAHQPTIINVHAREGLFGVRKTDIHTHTNMSKSAVAMLTATLAKAGLSACDGSAYRIHGVDPGWISIDEYFEESRPWIVPPLDERDGAVRILDPFFRGLGSEPRTRRHFNTLTY